MTITVLSSLNKALDKAMAEDSSVYLLGEDILDPYGGAFKVTRGLSSKYPNRVLTTPISEAGITGIAIGMSMRGLRPVVEIMFGDFLTLAADQLINHAAKFNWMYNEKVNVPVVIRTPMGGRRGYGPTHSQSLEKLFLGTPGLRVVAPSLIGQPGELLTTAIEDENPVLFIEHKLLYPLKLIDPAEGDIYEYALETSAGKYPATIFNSAYPAKVTIASYGYNLHIILAAINKLIMEKEIFCDVVIFSQLSPFDISPILYSVNNTNRLLTVEEGTMSAGWGAEIIARATEQSNLKGTKRVAALDLPIANTKNLENRILPSEQNIVDSVIQLSLIS